MKSIKMKQFIKPYKKVLIIFALFICLFLIGYVCRVDRFGFSAISWIDVVKYDGKSYVRYEYSQNNERNIAEDQINDDMNTIVAHSFDDTINGDDIGKYLGKVRFKVHSNVRNSGYKLRNYDATFLDKGTKIYEIKNDTNRESIAVLVDGIYYRYRRSK